MKKDEYLPMTGGGWKKDENPELTRLAHKIGFTGDELRQLLHEVIRRELVNYQRGEAGLKARIRETMAQVLATRKENLTAKPW